MQPINNCRNLNRFLLGQELGGGTRLGSLFTVRPSVQSLRSDSEFLLLPFSADAGSQSIIHNGDAFSAVPRVRTDLILARAVPLTLTTE